ncbi:hypothetical protein JCM10207_003271 [Rhodosporidiobolus poonsookiae]
MPDPSSSSAPSTSKRRSSLTFRGPATSKRIRSAPAVIDPIPARRALASKNNNKKRRRESGTSAAGGAAAKKQRGEGAAKKRAPGQGGEKQSTKGKGKQRRAPSLDSDNASGSDSGSDGDGDGEREATVRVYERHIPRATVREQWKRLSSAARDELRWQAEEAVRDTLDELPGPSTSALARETRAVLSRFTDEFDTLLSTLPIPPLPASLRVGQGRSKSRAHDRGKSKEMELGWLLDAGEMRRRIAILERAAEQEQADVSALEAKIADERAALEADETALAAFESARDTLQAAEDAELARKTAHPLVAPLLASRLSLSDPSDTRSNRLSVPGLPNSDGEGAQASEEREGRGVSRAWGVGGMAGSGKGSKARKRRDDEEEEGESADPIAATTRRVEQATAELKPLIRERRKGRKTSE